MTTQIFKTYHDFLNREDKKVNGVSEEFAKQRPDYEADNASNEGCWNCSGCSGCSRCSGCSGCSDCYDCSDCSDCYGCSGCSDCYGCSGCSGCSDCYDCYGCSDCYDWKDNQPPAKMEIPIIENIHQKVFDAVTDLKHSLKMDSWHTCDTTHCRAGWVIHLAGEKGYELERRTDPVFAAMQIYKASSPIRVSPTRFFEHNETAMADIKRCAEEEANLLRETQPNKPNNGNDTSNQSHDGEISV